MKPMTTLIRPLLSALGRRPSQATRRWGPEPVFSAFPQDAMAGGATRFADEPDHGFEPTRPPFGSDSLSAFVQRAQWRCRWQLGAEPRWQDTSADDALAFEHMRAAPRGRQAAERALEAGSQRCYDPMPETVVLEQRRQG